jgi:hypothetical protein
MPAEANRIVVELICPNCNARNPRRAHLCRSCRAQLAPFETRGHRRPAARAVVRPLVRKLSSGRNFTRPLADKLKPRLEQVKSTSEEALANEWRAIRERWRSVAESIREMTPTLPQAAQWLSEIESNLIEITGIGLDASSRSAAHLPLTEEFQWLRGRLSQAINDVEQMRKFQREPDMAQMVEAAVAALRFLIAALAILSISLDIADRLNPRKMLRRTLRGERI